jgi:hypothetical protein
MRLFDLSVDAVYSLHNMPWLDAAGCGEPRRSWDLNNFVIKKKLLEAADMRQCHITPAMR